MGTGGVPVQPVLRRRRPTKPDLIVLCDVSGSTAQFAPFTLTLLHAVHQEFRRVRSFVFIDGIVEITEILASSPGVLDPHHLLARKGLIAKDGRSDYRRAFTTFVDTWADAVTAKTTVIIAGDARSHNRVPAIAEVAELEHRARRLIEDDRRLASRFGPAFEELRASTSVIPFRAVLDGRQQLVLNEFLRPAQLGIAIAIGVFWWAHRFIGAGATAFSRTGLAHWLG